MSALPLWLLTVAATAAAAPATPPPVYWSVKTAVSRTHEEKTVAVPDAKGSVVLPTGHRCEITPVTKTETAAAFVYTRVFGCSGPESTAATTGTTASCSIPRHHGVAAISEPGKWFVFQGKEGSPINVTLSCGILPEN